MAKATLFAFDRVIVHVLPSNITVVEWEVNRHFIFNNPSLQFFIEVARSAGEFERLNPTAPVINDCMYADTNKYRCNMSNDIYYRVVAFDGVTEYTSHPEATMGVWSYRDLLIAKDVIRKEYVRLKQYIGTSGHLLRRRSHGPRCTECVDFDLGEPVSSTCGNCFGTGFEGGYYDAYSPYYLDLSGTTSIKDATVTTGTEDNKTTNARAVAYPRVGTYDIYVVESTNKRYVIRGVQTLVHIKGKPLVYTLRLQELPAGDVAFNIPLQQSLSAVYGSSSSPANITDGGWRDGISIQPVW